MSNNNKELVITPKELQSAEIDTKITYADMVEMLVDKKIQDILTEKESLESERRNIYIQINKDRIASLLAMDKVKEIISSVVKGVPVAVIDSPADDDENDDFGSVSISVTDLDTTKYRYLNRVSENSRGREEGITSLNLQTGPRYSENVAVSVKVKSITIKGEEGAIKYAVTINLPEIRVNLSSHLLKKIDTYNKRVLVFFDKYSTGKEKVINLNFNQLSRKVKSELTKRLVARDRTISGKLNSIFNLDL